MRKSSGSTIISKVQGLVLPLSERHRCSIKRKKKLKLVLPPLSEKEANFRFMTIAPFLALGRHRIPCKISMAKSKFIPIGTGFSLFSHILCQKKTVFMTKESSLNRCRHSFQKRVTRNPQNPCLQRDFSCALVIKCRKLRYKALR